MSGRVVLADVHTEEEAVEFAELLATEMTDKLVVDPPRPLGFGSYSSIKPYGYQLTTSNGTEVWFVAEVE